MVLPGEIVVPSCQLGYLENSYLRRQNIFVLLLFKKKMFFLSDLLLVIQMAVLF